MASVVNRLLLRRMVVVSEMFLAVGLRDFVRGDQDLLASPPFRLHSQKLGLIEPAP
jgi:hypothetical protein